MIAITFRIFIIFDRAEMWYTRFKVAPLLGTPRKLY